MSLRTRAPVLALVLLAFVSPARALQSWKFCAPQGGHCSCFGEMRFGHPGEAEHLANDGAYFKEHPEVPRWQSRNAAGREEPCGLSQFGDVDPFPELGNSKFCECHVPEEVVWKPCAGPGEVCDCAPSSLGEKQAERGGKGNTHLWEPKLASHTHAMVRATDESGAYYGVTSVDAEFRCPSDYPGARCDCLVAADAPDMTWQWCANNGGNCACDTQMRFGSTGSQEQYDSGYFTRNPLVTKWVAKDLSQQAHGMSKCGSNSFDGKDPFPEADKICQCMMPVRDPEEKVLAWQWCANEGGECECASAARFGSTGDASAYSDPDFFKQHPEITKWVIRGDAPGKVSCSQAGFDASTDPFPGQPKICQCLTERPRALGAAELIEEAVEVKHTDWSWCGEDGTRCSCDGLVRYGATGTDDMYKHGGEWFKEHPEVMKWTYLKSYGELECSKRTFGFDPFPDTKKICQCFAGYDEQFPYQTFRPEQAALGAAIEAAETLLLHGKVRDRPFVAQQIDEVINRKEEVEEVEGVEPESSAVEAVEPESSSQETKRDTKAAMAQAVESAAATAAESNDSDGEKFQAAMDSLLSADDEHENGVPRLGRDREVTQTKVASHATLGWALAVVVSAAVAVVAMTQRVARRHEPEKTPLISEVV